MGIQGPEKICSLPISRLFVWSRGPQDPCPKALLFSQMPYLRAGLGFRARAGWPVVGLG